jgi:hypothetical protein
MPETTDLDCSMEPNQLRRLCWLSQRAQARLIVDHAAHTRGP